MTPLVRYTLMQLPALALVALVGVVLWRLALLPGWLVAAAVALWAAKDVAFYPFVRAAYVGSGDDATARLLGRHGVARQPLAPSGYVALGSELWRAEVEPGAAPIAAGHAVRVVGARRLTLIVTRVE
jgi:membrane-bound ClpP family serine protease